MDNVGPPEMIDFFNSLLWQRRTLVLGIGPSISEAQEHFLCCFCFCLYQFLLDDLKELRDCAFAIWRYLLEFKLDTMKQLLTVRSPLGDELINIHRNGFDLLLQNGPIEFAFWLSDSVQLVESVFDQSALPKWNDYLANRKLVPTNMYIDQFVTQIKSSASQLSFMRRSSVQEPLHMLSLNESLRREHQWRSTWKRQLHARDNHASTEWNNLITQLREGEKALWPLHDAQMIADAGAAQLAYMEQQQQNDSLGLVNLSLSVFSPQWTGTDNATVLPQVFFQLDLAEGPGRVRRRIKNSVTLRESLLAVTDRKRFTTHSRLDSIFSQGSVKLSGTLQEPSSSSASSPDLTPHTQQPLTSISESGTGSEVNQQEDELEVIDVLSMIEDRGESILLRTNCARVWGLDKINGVFLICRKGLYFIDNFFINPGGDMVEIAAESIKKQKRPDRQQSGGNNGTSGGVSMSSASPLAGLDSSAPTDHHFALGGGASGSELNASSHCFAFRLPYELLHDLQKRRYLLVPCAMEIFAKDRSSFFLAFPSVDERDQVYKKIYSLNIPHMAIATEISRDLDIANRIKKWRKVRLRNLQSKWMRREISNFDYLMQLNTLAGRSLNDITQYPVFPWIIADYTSESLDLSDPSVYRDLSKPMGAQDAERAAKFKERFDEWEDESIPKFHYGTHYSTAGIVLHYLIRMEPFAHMSLQLQGGHFDHPDRLFHSMNDAWLSASKQSLADVKELIPEMFYLPEALCNINGLDLGKRQSGESVDDVVLPRWANGDPRQFVRLNRLALESELVSSNLHKWIDLIFGYKQRGKPAEEALNVYYYLTYEGGVKIEQITDPVQRSAMLSQIQDFGQTPKRLFKKPHPQRTPVKQSLPVAIFVHPEVLNCELETRIDEPVGQIVFFSGSTADKKLVAVGLYNKVAVPPRCHKILAWGVADRGLRFAVQVPSVRHREAGKVVSFHEGLHELPITCVCLTDDGETVITGSVDSTVAVWGLTKTNHRRTLQLRKRLCGHERPITCLAVSRTFNVIASGSEDGTCVLWDLNKLMYVRQLGFHARGVSKILINDNTGDVITVSGVVLVVWSINGDCLARVKTSDVSTEDILCVTLSKNWFWLEQNVIITGHRKGYIRLWSFRFHPPNNQDDIEERRYGVLKKLPSPCWQLYCRKRHQIPNSQGVSALQLSVDEKILWSGDLEGRVFRWFFKDEGVQDHWVKDEDVSACQVCDVAFSLTERRHHCRQCGSVVCDKCSPHRAPLPNKQFFSPVRICNLCFEVGAFDRVHSSHHANAPSILFDLETEPTLETQDSGTFSP
eukprot:GILJ01011136.1.p1 GENE.GILJ01011136.1~~GILJ01011136.1.p1  ORF type:complete len:1307 (+),score=181.80 GILJ01011136.1:246-4166(+)